MVLSLFTREPACLHLLDEMATQVRHGAAQLLDLVQHFDDLDRRGIDLKRQEQVCDELAARIVTDLNRVFTLTLYHEDVHALALRLDTVMDLMEKTAHRFVVFGIARPPAPVVRLTGILDECCAHLETAVQSCRNPRRAAEAQDHLRAIGRLENAADNIYREMDAGLFVDFADNILTLIKWRELYGGLEDAVDACKKVAHVLSKIIISAG